MTTATNSQDNCLKLTWEQKKYKIRISLFFFFTIFGFFVYNFVCVFCFSLLIIIMSCLKTIIHIGPTEFRIRNAMVSNLTFEPIAHRNRLLIFPYIRLSQNFYFLYPFCNPSQRLVSPQHLFSHYYRFT